MRNLQLSLTSNSLSIYLNRQICHFFPDEKSINNILLDNCVNLAIERLKICFDPVISKYYFNGKNSTFNHLNGDHYATFLYFVSNNAYIEGDYDLATKIFLLNKALFGLDAFYSINLPEHFLLVHPVGTILGNADYGDYFVIYQGVTIGSTNDGCYPTFNDSTILYSNTSVLGNCKIGKNFILGANSTLVNNKIEDNKVVLGNYPNNKIIDNVNNLIINYYNF